MDLENKYPIHTLEFGTDFVTAFVHGDAGDRELFESPLGHYSHKGLILHNSDRFHHDDPSMYWVNDYFGPQAAGTGYTVHYHAETLNIFKGYFNPRILDGISI